MGLSGHELTKTHLVGAAAEAVRARTARRGRAEPPSRSPRGRDLVPQVEWCAAGGVDDDDAPRAVLVRGGRARVAPRARARNGGGRSAVRGAAGGAAPRVQAPRGG